MIWHDFIANLTPISNIRTLTKKLKPYGFKLIDYEKGYYDSRHIKLEHPKGAFEVIITKMISPAGTWNVSIYTNGEYRPDLSTIGSVLSLITSLAIAYGYVFEVAKNWVEGRV